MTAMFRTNQCVVVTLPLFLISSAPLAIQTYKKHNSGGVIKMVALMPVRKKCVKYLSTIVYCLHAVKILEVFIKMYIFSNISQTTNFMSDSPETMRKLCLSAKFPHQEIR